MEEKGQIPQNIFTITIEVLFFIFIVFIIFAFASDLLNNTLIPLLELFPGVETIIVVGTLVIVMFILIAIFAVMLNEK